MRVFKADGAYYDVTAHEHADGTWTARIPAACFPAAGESRYEVHATAADGWYTPPEWSFPGWAAQWSQDGLNYVCMVDNKGKIEWGDKMPSNVAVKKAVEEAVAARCEAVKLQDQIKTLGENLAALDWDKMLAEVEDTSSGATASGSVERKIDRLVIAADGLLSGGLAPDGVSVVTNDAGKLALANIPAKLVVPEVFPYWNGKGLGWTTFVKLFDDTSLSVEAKADAPKDADGDVLIDVSGTVEAHYSEVFDEPWQSRKSAATATRPSFNSRAREGATDCPSPASAEAGVSIHAPTRGATNA